MKKSFISLAILAVMIPQEALAADVYIPWVCQTVSTGALDCNPVSASAVLDVATDTWEITVATGDTVYMQVSNFTEGSDNWSVSAITTYATGRVAWSKSGSTATSPGDSPTQTFSVHIEATTGTSSEPVKLGRGERNIRIRGTGG